MTVPSIDDPHTPETVIAAARTVDEAIRYLNHATIRTEVLRDPTDLFVTLAGLTAAVDKLPQLLNQLAATADRYTTTSGLYDTGGRHPHVTAADVRDSLRAAWDRAVRLGDPMRAAHEGCARLGIQGGHADA